MIPELSSLGAHGTIVPFVFIMTLTAIKELYEDFRRFISDRQVNNRTVQAYDPKIGWKKTFWYELKVGQIVKVTKDDHIPADLILISSSEPAGMAYIETANLDGESNLKIRQSLILTSVCVTDEAIEALACSNSIIKCEPPNCLIYDFTGVLQLHKNFVNVYQRTEFTIETAATASTSFKEFDFLPLSK